MSLPGQKFIESQNPDSYEDHEPGDDAAELLKPQKIPLQQQGNLPPLSSQSNVHKQTRVAPKSRSKVKLSSEAQASIIDIKQNADPYTDTYKIQSTKPKSVQGDSADDQSLKPQSVKQQKQTIKLQKKDKLSKQPLQDVQDQGNMEDNLINPATDGQKPEELQERDSNISSENSEENQEFENDDIPKIRPFYFVARELHSTDFAFLSKQKVCLKLQFLDSNFSKLKKSKQENLSTIQHEHLTDFQTKATIMSQFIEPLTTQTQHVFFNDRFTTQFVNQIADRPQILPRQSMKNYDNGTYFLDAGQMPIGNGLFVDFCSEKLTIVEAKQYLLKENFLLIELVKLPTWQQPKQEVVGFGILRLQEIDECFDKEIDIYVYKQTKNRLELLRKMFSIRPWWKDIQELDVNSSDFDLLFSKPKGFFCPKPIGLIKCRFGFEKKNVKSRRIQLGKLPIYPYDDEIGKQVNIQKDEQQEDQEEMKPDLDPILQEIDWDLRNNLDKLIMTPTNNIGFTPTNIPDLSSQSCSNFQSVSVACIAQPSVGNTSICAAAVLCESEAYNICLYNIHTGELLMVLGTHYGYVYKLEFSPCGRYLMSCSADGCIQIFLTQPFVYYGFNFYQELKNAEDIQLLINVIRKKTENADVQLTKKENELFQQLVKFMEQKVVSKLDLYQYGSFQQDLKLIKNIQNIKMLVGLMELNRFSSDAMQFVQEEFQIIMINEGLCIYDCIFFQVQDSLQMMNFSLDLIHNIDVEVPESEQIISIITGGLSGKLMLHRVHTRDQTVISDQINEHGKHFINCIKIYRKSMIISASQSGEVKFTSLSIVNNQISAQEQRLIQCQNYMKDFVILPYQQEINGIMQKRLRICSLSSFGCVQIHDDTGKLLVNINQQFENRTQLDLQQQKTPQWVLNSNQFPGSMRLSTDATQQFVFVPLYGGGIGIVNKMGKIIKNQWLLKRPQYGVIPNQIVYNSSYNCFITSFNIIVSEEQQVLNGFQPPGIPELGQLPIFGLGIANAQLQWKIGTVQKAKVDEEQIPLVTGGYTNNAGSIGQEMSQSIGQQSAIDQQIFRTPIQGTSGKTISPQVVNQFNNNDAAGDIDALLRDFLEHVNYTKSLI